MTEFIIQLKPLDGPSMKPGAWFIPGGSVIGWIEEICRWKVPQHSLRLYAMRSPHAAQGCSGLFVILGSGVSSCCQPRAMAFSAVADKFFIPSDAKLYPPCDPNELRLLYFLQVYHPVLGFVGFDETDTLRLSDLLRRTPSRVELWNSARSGVHCNDRLRSIQLIAPLDPTELFGDAPNEIGIEPLAELPPTPQEPRANPGEKILTEGSIFLAKAVFGFAQLFPRRGTRRTWLNDLEDWASAKAQKLQNNLEFERNKEINRLLHQLQNNPEEGLKFAIPMSQFGNHRGNAPPAGRLANRDPNFNAKNLGGGAAADFWNLSAQMQTQLRTKYRELANRELQLGRFRRAAYIFAELLGDLDSAASALKQGKHFREAALVYKDHLHRSREAAACLAEGGLYVQALEIYEKEECYIEAGDLYLQIGQRPEADAQYEHAVAKCLKAADRLGAARLLEQKLNRPEEALQVLAAGWPASAQNFKCLEAQFDLLGRMKWHPKATETIRQWRAQLISAELTIQLVQFLSSLHSKYPDTCVREAAADVARLKASQQLDSSSAADALKLSDALVKLAPEDKLLARDAIRFVAAKNDQLLTRRKHQPVGKLGGPILIHTFNLPPKMRWHTVKSCGPYFFAAGYAEKKLVLLLRGDWTGVVQGVSWPTPNEHKQESLLLEIDETISAPAAAVLWQLSMGRLPFSEQPLYAANRFHGLVITGKPDWLPIDCLAVCTRGDMIWLLRATAGLTLECRKNGDLIGNTELNEVKAALTNDGAFHNFQLVVQRDATWIAHATSLFLYRTGKPLRSWKCESNILSMAPSPPHLPLQIVTTHERGVAVHSLNALKNDVEIICPELIEPLAGFTTDGLLVLMAEKEGRVCELNTQGVSKMCTFEWPDSKPLAIVRAESPRQFAVFSEQGKVQLFRVQE